MDIYKANTIEECISGNPYVGRGILLGKSADGAAAVSAYFIMGRSANSRNRIFNFKDDVLYTEPFDSSKVEDPSLIIYAALREWEDNLILTNGDQTDTVYEGLRAGKSFSEALLSREFEPDAPNLTPRISGLIRFRDGDFNYSMSILKSADAAGTACARYCFDYPALPGLGHLIHTYVTDGNPLPTFQGEPERVALTDGIDELTKRLWDALDKNNKISLYVRYTDLKTGAYEHRIVNKNK